MEYIISIMLIIGVVAFMYLDIRIYEVFTLREKKSIKYFILDLLIIILIAISLSIIAYHGGIH